MRHQTPRLASWLYRQALRLCVPTTIGEPDEMVQVFELELSREARKGGWWAATCFAFGALADTATFAFKSWWRSGAGDGRGAAGAPTKKHLEENPMSTLWNQIRFAGRSCMRAPGHSTVAILVITLAVGLTATTLNTVSGVLSPSLPFDRGDQVMALDLTVADGATGRVEFEALDLMDFRDAQQSFENLEGYLLRRVNLGDKDGRTQSVRAGVVTAGALSHLGVNPHLGRTFREGEDFTRSIQHVVLGYDLWQRRYGGRSQVLGTTVHIDGQALQVIGIMPSGFRFPVNEELWLPMDFDLPVADRGSGRSFSVFGRLHNGVEIAAAQSEAEVIAARIGEKNPAVHPPLSAKISPFAQRHLPAGMASLLIVMFGAVLGLLLIACANVANLLLARALARHQETALRRALGASRGSIVRQFLSEALVLVASGSALGLITAFFACDILERAMSSRLTLPYWADLGLHAPVAWVTVALTAVIALVAGTLPALASTSDRVNSIGGGRVTHDRRSRWTSSWLVTTQIAASCALLIASGLLTRSLIQLRTLDLGFDAESIATARLSLSASEYPEPAARSAFFLELLEKTAALPGVTDASLIRDTPGTGPTFAWEFSVEGAQHHKLNQRPSADGVPVAHGYFDTMGIELLMGRDFTKDESRFGTQPVIIVNEYLAQHHLGDMPLGRRITLNPDDPTEPWLTVVGVVEDTYIGSYSGGFDIASVPKEQMYISWGVAPYRSASLLLRHGGEGPTAQIPQIRTLMQEIAPHVPLYSARGLESAIVESTWAFGLFGTLFGVFGLVALAISVIGLYGVMAFAVGERRQELGVRLVLGATRGRVLSLVISAAAWQVTFGIAGGLGLGLLLGRAIRALLFNVSPADPLVYGAIVVALATTALLAAIIPGRTALRIEPVEVLRS